MADAGGRGRALPAARGHRGRRPAHHLRGIREREPAHGAGAARLRGGSRRQSRGMAAQPARVALRPAGLRHGRRRPRRAQHPLQGARAVLHPGPVRRDHPGPIDFLETLGEVLPGLRDGEPGQLSLAGFPRVTRVIMDAEDPYPGCLRLSDVLEAGGEPEWERALPAARAATGPDDPWTILYTSGTTSFPKGAVISHRNAIPHGWYSGKVLQVTEADRVLHALPMSGTWGGLSVPLSTIAHGACLILMETFEPAVALHLIEREGVTIWNAVDAMVIGVLDHPDLARRKRGTLRTGGFGFTGGGRDGLFDDILHTLGVPQAYQPYGMTELNALSMLHALDESPESRAQSGAWAPEGLEVRVVDSATG